MAYTLDQLLSQTGIDEISGEQLTKKAAAAERPNLSKLAERCRRAVNATADERVSADQQGLAEKTAAVEIIGRTLAEIRAISTPPDQVKTASTETPDLAVFIKTALDQGHRPDVIAEFLDKNAGLFGRGVRRGVRRFKEWRAGKTFAKGERRQAAGTEIVKGSGRRYRALVRELENAPEAQRATMLARMRIKLGPQNAYDIVNQSGGKNWKAMGSFKDLKKTFPKPPSTTPGAPGAPGKAVGVNVGGTQVGLTAEQLKKMRKPALYLGGGAVAHRAITGPKEDRGGSRGRPVIITG